MKNNKKGLAKKKTDRNTMLNAVGGAVWKATMELKWDIKIILTCGGDSCKQINGLYQKFISDKGETTWREIEGWKEY